MPDTSPRTPASSLPNVATVERTLLLTDLVGSTRLVEELGDLRAADLGARHDEVARSLLAAHDGVEIDKTDGFLLLFDTPLAALRFAFAYHDALRTLSAELEVALQARVGIHHGEVVLRRNPAEHVARGAKPVEVEGIAKPTAARLMSLAAGEQTLLTRVAFDEARLTAGADTDLRWLAHGPFQFKGLEAPVEVFEVGRPGRAPLTRPPDGEKARRVLAPDEEELLGWRPGPGLLVPGRPDARLVRKLGEGGFGEVWLAEVAGVGQRAFKFCFEAERLRGLKREVALFRVLRDALGERPDIARVVGWNLESPPSWVESDYTAGGSLEEWVAAQGGLERVPLATRVRLVAEVATALAAAHSVGVLHKDIKPGNVLVRPDADGAPRAVLGDFGVGLLSDAAAEHRRRDLHAMGLSVSDFTPSGAGARGGTPMYLPPEVLEGGIATTEVDVYALGVVLYQVAVGDLRRALAPGWERELADPELREDIAACVARDPAGRPAASAVASRLRAQEVRRAARRAEEERVAREARARAGRRTAMGIAAAAIFLALVALALWRTAEVGRLEAERQQARADRARADAEALLSYVDQELYRELERLDRVAVLDATSQRVLAYYETLAPEDRGPHTALDHAHALLLRGTVLGDLGDAAGAAQAFASARRLAGEATGGDAHEADEVAGAALVRAVEVATAQGEARVADAREAERLLRRAPVPRGETSELNRAQRALAAALLGSGDPDGARGVLEAAAAAREAAPEPDAEVVHDLALTWMQLGDVHAAVGRDAEALAAYDRQLAWTEDLHRREGDTAGVLGALATAHNRRGTVLESLGRPDEALAAYAADLALSERLARRDPENARWQDALGTTWNSIAGVRRDQGDLDGALAALEQTLAVKRALAAREPDNAEWRRNLGVTWGWIGSVQELRGDRRAALEAYRAYDAEAAPLIARNPGNVDLLSDALVARRRLAHLAGALGQAAEARRLVDEAEAAHGPVARAHLDQLGTVWGRFLVVTAEARRRTGDPAGGLAAAREAAEVLGRVEDPGEAVLQDLARARALFP